LAVYTNAPGYARTLLELGKGLTPSGDPEPEVRRLIGALLGPTAVHVAPMSDASWGHIIVTGYAPESQYDQLIRLARAGLALPDGVACVARTGDRFHGFRGRAWAGSPGNIHLAAHFAPDRPVERFGTAFMALAAVSVVDAIDSVPGLEGRARIRWVNDVVLDGAKVAGVLAHSQTRGATVTSVVLGIGINVETTPAVVPTVFVPAVTSLGDHAPDPATATEGVLLRALLRALGRNYRALLEHGFGPLMGRYRARSAVLDRDVLISADEPDEVPRILAAGRVAEIGDGLELHLAGRPEPITRGRLILDPPGHASYQRAS
jgi:BirA family transcriptional regulator, biotin operon repressor / biotin---[acetyl-CoA-carboxylase] ligase